MGITYEGNYSFAYTDGGEVHTELGEGPRAGGGSPRGGKNPCCWSQGARNTRASLLLGCWLPAHEHEPGMRLGSSADALPAPMQPDAAHTAPRTWLHSSQSRGTQAFTTHPAPRPRTAGVYTSWQCGPEPGEQAHAGWPDRSTAQCHPHLPVLPYNCLLASKQGAKNRLEDHAPCALPPAPCHAGSYLAIVELTSVDIEGNIIKQMTACEYGLVFNDLLKNTWWGCQPSSACPCRKFCCGSTD